MAAVEDELLVPAAKVTSDDRLEWVPLSLTMVEYPQAKGGGGAHSTIKDCISRQKFYFKRESWEIMPGCAAPGCTSHSRNGFRMFRFPADTARQAVWLQMMRRDAWQPTRHSRLCEVHYEESEFEPNRRDGKNPLKRTAIPRLFNVPNELRTRKTRKAPIPRLVHPASQQSVIEEQAVNLFDTSEPSKKRLRLSSGNDEA